MRDQIRRLLTKLQSSITRGIIKLVDDEKQTQTIQVELRFDEIADAIELFQPFGVSFNPTKDSEVLVLAIGSSQDNLVALNATDRSIRPTGIKEGEGGLYTPSGWKVFCDETADTVSIAAQDGADWIARADRVDAMFAAVSDALTAGALGATDGGLDGGAAAFTAAQTAFDAATTPTKSDKGKVT
jgi:phage baseplate assembly protein V